MLARALLLLVCLAVPALKLGAKKMSISFRWILLSGFLQRS
jgi:hypothetical protein